MSSTTSSLSASPSLSDRTLPDIHDRWEVLFVYGFIARFTPLKSSRKCAMLNTPMDLENALLFNGSTPVLHAILEHFLQNLWGTPNHKNECNTTPQHIERTLNAVIHKYTTNSKERTVWWSVVKHRNVVPFTAEASEGHGAFFFCADLDTKLKVLRQLVEWQLVHCEAVKSLIDDAWGVKHKVTAKAKSEKARELEKKSAAAKSTTDETVDPKSILKPNAVASTSDSASAMPTVTKADLELVPLGMDRDRKRYWIADDSPRVWVSGNPWKQSCPFEALSSSRSELDSLLTSLKLAQPPVDVDAPRSKTALSHDSLLLRMEGRAPLVDAELERIERVIKKQQEKEAAEARMAELAERRETRTRARTRVDYAAVERGNTANADDDDDGEHEEDEDDDHDDQSSAYEEERKSNGSRSHTSRIRETTGSSALTASASVSSRASSSAVDNTFRISSTKRKGPPLPEWRGERRSTRLTGGKFQLDGEDIQMTEDDFDTPDQTITRPAEEPRIKKRRIMSPDVADTPSTTQLTIQPAPRRPPRSTGPVDGSTDGEHTSLATPSLVSDHGGVIERDDWDSSSLSSLPNDSDEDDDVF